MPKPLFRSRVSLAVSAALSVTTVLGVGIRDVSAQDKVERVEVTGSNIRRAQSETASPVQVISRDDLEKSGKATVADYLQTLAIDGAGSVPPSFGNGFAPGSAGISLRGLGASSTLVLLNGRRMAPYGLADDGQKVFTDLSTVPMEAVDRIEILKDGASSIYGSDAIAGVVNIILRSSFEGTVAKASVGTSRYHDGNQHKISVTHGWGNLASDGMNMFFNLDVSGSDAIFDKDRNRDWIGKSDIRPWGYDQFGGGVPLAGYIVPGNASSSPAGNIRSPGGAGLPAAGTYQSLPGCARFSSVSPQDPGGGCLWAPSQFRTMMPGADTATGFGRATWRLSNDTTAYMEMTYSQQKSEFQQNPSGVSGSWGFPGGPVNASSGAGATVLAATHPDNPLGVGGVRLRYSAFDVGPRVTDTDNTFTRVSAGLKGKLGEWDYDTAFVLSNTSLIEARKGFLRYSVVKAALGDPTSIYFPYRIGVNSGLNPASLYAAMSPTIYANAKSKMNLIDFKASRDLMQLSGGPMTVALGAEYRHEQSTLTPNTFTDQGDIIGLGFSAYDGRRNIAAAYAELLAPLHKMLEVSAAVRTDQYSGLGSSTTPKVGVKITPVRSLALRGTYAEGFRAPNAAESGTGGLAAFTTVRDPIRCPGGVPAAGATATDCAQSIAIITAGNPSLKPEKSKGATLGFIWDPLPTTSLSVDAWQIKRSNEINATTATEAVGTPGAATRSDNNLAGIPGSGSLLAVAAPYINSANTTVRGTDVDFRHRWDLGQYGKTIFEVRWTHLSSFLRKELDGTSFQFAGTHGNCDTTNCIGTPKDKVNLVLTWERANWRVAALVNWRSSFKNVAFDGDTCASAFADGSDAPAGCKIPAFWTTDLSVRWKAQRNLEFFGSIQNLFDKVAPLDPLTYGAVSYNPLDISGAIGRFYSAGLRYQFR
jgi:iron complex outermembrane recepter protein